MYVSVWSVHKEEFEKPFLEETAEDYRRESSLFLSNHDVSSYMKKIYVCTCVSSHDFSLCVRLPRKQSDTIRTACVLYARVFFCVQSVHPCMHSVRLFSRISLVPTHADTFVNAHPNTRAHIGGAAAERGGGPRAQVHRQQLV